MRSRIYAAGVDSFGVLTVDRFEGFDTADAATYAEDYPDVIYFEVVEPLTIDAVKRAIRDNSHAVTDWLAQTIVTMGAFDSYDDLEGAIVDGLAEFARGNLDLPALSTANLDAYRAAADAAGIDHDGDTIGA